MVSSKEETPHNLTFKSMKDMAVDVMERNKIIDMFQAMTIVSLKMGNLGLKVQSLKTRLTIVKREKTWIASTNTEGTCRT